MKSKREYERIVFLFNNKKKKKKYRKQKKKETVANICIGVLKCKYVFLYPARARDERCIT